MEAKDLNLESVYLRCEPPPSAKRTPILFPGWVCVKSDCADNVFQGCALLQDRSYPFLQMSNVNTNNDKVLCDSILLDLIKWFHFDFGWFSLFKTLVSL